MQFNNITFIIIFAASIAWKPGDNFFLRKKMKHEGSVVNKRAGLQIRVDDHLAEQNLQTKLLIIYFAMHF